VFLRIRPTPEEAAMHDALMTYAGRVWDACPAGSSGARLAVTVLARRACSSAGSLARSAERRLELLFPAAATPPELQGVLPFATGGDEPPDLILGASGFRDAAQERMLLEDILRLARAAALAESKIIALSRLLARTLEPAIVFTEYRDTLQRLAVALTCIDAVQLHGGLTLRERTEVLRRFTTGDARLLLATDAGSEGLNLHHRCRLVINLELPWTPTRIEQRVGRVDRIGQVRRVHAIHLVAARSCEESTLARIAVRTARLRATMDPLTPLPDERRVAESALAGAPLPEIDASAAIPPGVTTIDLRREAEEEASRIHIARGLLSAGDVVPDGRPVMARFHGRRHRSASPRGIWLFRVVFADPAGEQAWEAMIPMGGILLRRPVNLIAYTRAALDPRQPLLLVRLLEARDAARRQLSDSLVHAVRLWCAREKGLVAELQQKRARLSAVLLQPGLFHPGRQRDAASQHHALNEALGRCEARLGELESPTGGRVDSCELVLAAMLG
jgi:hypothetical protein